MFAESGRTLSRATPRAGHPERHIDHPEGAAGVLDLGEPAAMGNLRIIERFRHVR